MGSLKRAALAGAAMFALVPPALAADLPPLIQKAPVPVAEFGGWYLRGDIGISNERAGSFYQNGFGGAPLPSAVQQVTKEFSGAGIFGLGVGYEFNSWLRADITGEYRSASTFRGYDIVTAANGTTLIPEHPSVNKTEWVFLGNAYIDLGTWWSVTPFVGAGIGVANVRLNGFNDFAIASLDPVGGATLLNANNSAPDGSKWNFAWAVHAGLAYKVNPNVTVEFAYRYLDLGDGRTGSPITGFDGTVQGTDFHIDNITSHDLKLGIRWLFSEPEYFSPPPLVRKG
jgi:opacity protein-like surface antigen